MQKASYRDYIFRVAFGVFVVLASRSGYSYDVWNIPTHNTADYQSGYPINYANTNHINDFQTDISFDYFQQAKQFANRGDIQSLRYVEQDMQRAGGLFAIYPAYWQLNVNLEQQSPTSIGSFVNQYPKTVWAEKLVTDYIEKKASLGDYQAIRQVAYLVENPDREEGCALALGFNKSYDNSRAMIEKEKVWLDFSREQKPYCYQLASELDDNILISNDDRLQRLKRLLRVVGSPSKSQANHLGRFRNDIVRLSNRLNIGISYQDLDNIKYNPQGFFAQFGYQNASIKNQLLYLYALSLLAYQNFDKAVYQLEVDIQADKQRLYPLLDNGTRQYAYRILAAHRMNMNTDLGGFDANVLTWFQKSMPETFNQEEAEAYALAAIRFSQWNDLKVAIQQMDFASQASSRWQYWLARALEYSANNSERQRAKQIWQAIAQKEQGNYYGFLSQDKLNQSYNINALGGYTKKNISPQDMGRVWQSAHFARALKLYQANMLSEANREWNWGVKLARENQDLNLLLAAAETAESFGWYRRSMYTIENSPVKNIALSHPMPSQYDHDIRRYSRSVGIDPAWTYAIIRQESNFNVNAHSTANAQGLMQVLPSTGRTIARNLGIRNFNLKNSKTNIQFGTWYLNNMLNKTGNVCVATASYNAGFNAAINWKPKHHNLQPDQFVETIPYYETRDYVKKVMENMTIYSLLLGNPKSISQNMGIIYP